MLFTRNFKIDGENMHENINNRESFFISEPLRIPEPEIGGNSHGFPNARILACFALKSEPYFLFCSLFSKMGYHYKCK